MTKNNMTYTSLSVRERSQPQPATASCYSCDAGWVDNHVQEVSMPAQCHVPPPDFEPGMAFKNGGRAFSNINLLRPSMASSAVGILMQYWAAASLSAAVRVEKSVGCRAASETGDPPTRANAEAHHRGTAFRLLRVATPMSLQGGHNSDVATARSPRPCERKTSKGGH